MEKILTYAAYSAFVANSGNIGRLIFGSSSNFLSSQVEGILQHMGIYRKPGKAVELRMNGEEKL